MDLTERARAALRESYGIDREAGRGGMATVFRARDLRHERPVAVKVLHPDLAASLGTERFLREVRITARLSHPHILPLLDSGETDGLLWYVMPFVEGESLRARLDRSGALPVEEAVLIAREVADALSYAHARGIVHRDIKPENILLESGHALVSDFGIAHAVDEAAPERLTATGMAVGTPYYMSPEQMEGQSDIDPRSDLYSLGCVLYEMLTGAPPLAAPTLQALAIRRLSEPAPSVRTLRETVPPAVESAVARSLERQPADRFQTAGDLVAALAPTALAPPPAHAARPPHRIARYAAAGAGILAIVALAWAGLRGSSDAPEDPATIAVLPFVNQSADSTQEYFADGLTDELITSLSSVPGLRVASRTSSFAYKDSALDVREIGRRLGVGSVIEGSIRRGEGRVRVSSQIVNVADGYQSWSETYERDAQHALVIQEEIAQAIVQTLRGRLGAQEREAVRATTTDPEAYDLYLRGKYWRYRRTEEGLRRAVELFQDAVDRAPDFARAYSGMGEAYAVLGFYDYEPPRRVFPLATRAAREALRIDPDLGEAHATLGYGALYYDWDWTRSEAEFRLAIERDPEYSTAHQWYANFLTARGRFDEAEQAMRRAQALEPLALIVNAALGWVFYYAGDYEQALGQYRSTIELDSTFVLAYLWRGQAEEMVGRPDDAIASFRRAVDLSGRGGIFVAALARSLALRGETREAEQLLAELEAARTVPAFEIAKVHAALGRRDRALAWLDRAIEDRSHSMVFLRVDPELEWLRADPAFSALAERVGL